MKGPTPLISMQKLSTNRRKFKVTGLLTSLALCCSALAQQRIIEVPVTVNVPGQTPPVLVSLSGFTGEGAEVLKFDLYVQGFAFTNAESAQYLISGSDHGNIEGRVTDPKSKRILVNKAYSGAQLRRQAHKFADDFLESIGRKGIGSTRIAFKGETPSGSEIFVADFDGHNVQAVTADHTIVSAPCWVPGRSALLYGSYKYNHADIFFQNLSTRERTVFARFGGSNMSPAVSPDGSQVAMILSKDGWPDLYVGEMSGGAPRRLTKSPQDESSPCWSPDGRWICFAAKENEHRGLCKIPAGGGPLQRISTSGVPSPTEPDWSPDNQWIAFTAQYRDFQICVIPAAGGSPTLLVEGEDPSWAPNSRTLIYCRRHAGRYVLSLLDVPTKQYKDVSRISGSNSQSQPSWAK